MVLDFLPYRIPRGGRRFRGWGRYVVFFLSLVFVGALFLSGVSDAVKEEIIFKSFIIGNLLYYAAGIFLAFALKDNRAFCKYLCPAAVFLKMGSRFALLRIKVDESACTGCGACRRVCPMEVDLTDPSRKRKNGTECILCLSCVKACPQKAVRL